MTEQRTETAAEVFERLFLPAMAGPWAHRLVEAAGVRSGERVLDVACGTGAVAQVALERVRDTGAVAGLDLSAEMLAVARRKLPDVDLHEGRAEKLPFGDGVFDVALCQFGLMFFENRAQAVREMLRVLREGGRMAVVVWDSLERSPGYAALTDIVEARLGPEAGAPIRASFSLGDPDQVAALLQEAGVTSVEARSVPATARFPSLRDWVDAEVKGWVGGDFGEREYAALLEDAERSLSPYRHPDGTTEFDLPAIVATGTKS
jgi:SAM-dependent methyltransferase